MKSRLFPAAICFFFLTTSITFAYNVTWLPRISVNEEYTDNALLTQNSDLKEDDFITTVTPGFTGDLIGKKGDVKIMFDSSYAFYNRFTEYDGWRHKGRLSGRYMPAKNTQLNVRDNFLYTEDPERNDNLAIIRTEDPTIPVDSTERKSRRIYTTNYANVGLNHQFGKYHSFRLGFTHALLSNDDPRYEDKQSYTPSAGLTYWFGPKWGFDVNGSYTRGVFEVSDNVNQYQGSVSLLKRYGKHFTGYIRYTHFVVNYDGPSGTDTTYIPTIGFQYDIEKDISLIADVGFFYTDSDTRDNTSNVTGDLRLIKRYEHGTLNLAVLGGYDYSLYGAERLGYGEYYEASISFNRQIAKHVSGNIFGSYRDTKYKDQSDREDKRPIIGANIDWQALKWMVIGLTYRFRSVDSTLETADYNENRIGVRVTLTPKVPFHTSRY